MSYFFLISFHLFLFQNIISNYIFKFRFFDEIYFFVIFFMFFVIITMRPERKRYLSSEERRLIKYIPILIIIGLIPNIIYKYQLNKIAIMKDILCICKFMLCYFMSLVVGNNLDKDKLLKKISGYSRVYVSVIFLFSIINIFKDIGMSFGYRYGIRSYKFLYNHPTYLVFSLVVLITVLIAEGNKRNNLYIFLGLISLFLTFRSKAIVYIFICIFVCFKVKKITKIKVSYIIGFAIVGIVLTYGKILEYISWGTKAARTALYSIGIDIFCDNFPFGSGFGTFASSLSGKYYSNIYYVYELNNVWGMTPKNYSYIADTFWPYIYGQFGFFGLIIFLYILYKIFKSIYSRCQYSPSQFKAMILIICYILISSTSEAIFIDYTGEFAFFVLSSFVGNNVRNMDTTVERSELDDKCYCSSLQC